MSAPPEPPQIGRPEGGLRSATIWSYVLTGSRIGTGVVVLFVLAKLLGPTEFGLLAMAMLVLQLFYKLTQQGFVAAIVQREQLTKDHLDAAFLTLLLSGAGGMVLMAAIAPLWAMATREPLLAAVCLALSPLVLVDASAIVPEALLQRAMRYRAIALRILAAALLSGTAGIALALAGAGVWALVAQQVSFGLVNAIVLWAFSPWRPHWPARPGAVRELWRFSVHSASAGIAMMVSNRADQYLVGILFGPVTMGIYRLAIRLPEMLVEVTAGSLEQVALPTLSALQQDRATFAARLEKLQHLAAVTALPALGVLAGTAVPLVAFLGPQWDGAALPLQLLCLWGLVSVYGALLSPALQAIGRPGLLATLTWLRGGVAAAVIGGVGLMLVDITPSGQAAAIALLATGVELAVIVATIRMLNRSLADTKAHLVRPTLPPLTAAIAAFVTSIGLVQLGLIDAYPFVALVVVGFLSALAALVVLWSCDRQVRGLVRERFQRAPDPIAGSGRSA